MDEQKTIKQSQKILITAFKCLASKGYAHVTTRDIANEAGVVQSQLNYYYKNKEGLFIAVIEMMAQNINQDFERILKNAATLKEKLTALSDYFRELLRNNPDLLKVFIDFSAQSLWVPAFKNLLKDLFTNLTDIIENNLINELKSFVRLEEYSSESIAKFIFGALYGRTTIQMIYGFEEGKRSSEYPDMSGFFFNLLRV